jgi:Bacterial Ig domain
MRVGSAVTVAALLATAVLGPTALAQESQAGRCVVSIGRGATAVGGATGAMTVRGGRACRIVNFSIPEQRVPTSRLEVHQAPAQGRLEIVQPNVVVYTPTAGYSGPDEFQYGGSGPGLQGRAVPFNVRVSVRVVGPDEPLR